MSDRVELTDAEREALNAANRSGRGWYEAMSRTHAAVESIVAARLSALTAERDEALSDIRQMLGIEAERDAARAELAAANDSATWEMMQRDERIDSLQARLARVKALADRWIKQRDEAYDYGHMIAAALDHSGTKDGSNDE